MVYKRKPQKGAVSKKRSEFKKKPTKAQEKRDLKNKVADFTCIGYSTNGSGIIDAGGTHIEVPGVLKDEKIRVSLEFGEQDEESNLYNKNVYSGAKLLKVLEYSQDRTKPPCPHYDECGGCRLQHMKPKAQELFKLKSASKALRAVGKVSGISMMDYPYSYRNKSHHSFGLSKSGDPIWGLYREGTHDLVPITRCLIHDEKADNIANTITKLMQKYQISPFDEDSLSGDLRHVLIRVAKGTGELLVVLVTGETQFPMQRQFIKDLLDYHPEITSVVRNINSKKTSQVLGRKEHVLHGAGSVVDDLAKLKFYISASSFYQVNHEQTGRLYQHAVDIARLSKKDTVLDAYCGIGTIALLSAMRAGEVVGVEINSAAISDAIKNSKINSISNASFVVADAAKHLRSASKAGMRYDVIFVDPPRSGCSNEFISALIEHAPQKLIYISCNPQTQARDISQLKKAGFIAKRLKAFDMFPQTAHVESVVLMTRG